MREKEVFLYQPDYSVHPGEYLEEVIESRKMKKREVADRLNISVKTLSQIINKKAYITPEMAIQFEHVLNISANIWNNMSSDYRLYEARVGETAKIEKNFSWIDQFPIKDLKRRKFLPDTNDKEILFKSLLSFFGVSSPKAWHKYYSTILKSVHCKKSDLYEENLPHLASWLREGEIKAQKIVTKPYSREVFMNNIKKIRELTVKPVEIFEPKLVNYCAEAGVAVVFVPECEKTHIWGLTRWLNSEKAVIMLSLRYKTNDHFWFSFFHEAGHIILHYKKQIFIEGKNRGKMRNSLVFEETANKFASNILIPPEKYELFIKNNIYNINAIIEFAKKINIHTGILIGRLEHDKKIDYGKYNKFKERYEFVDNYKE